MQSTDKTASPAVADNSRAGAGNNGQAHLLIVDDEESIRRTLGQMLKVYGFSHSAAENAAQARRMLKDQHFDLILCDVRMPGESGIELIKFVVQAFPEIAFIMVSAVDDPESAQTAMEIGAYSYILKPFKTGDVINNIENALYRRKLEIDNLAYQENLEQMINMRTAELQEMVDRMRKTMDGIVQAMALTIETRDPYTAGHQRRVAGLACETAKEMGISEDRICGLRMAGDIHDLGKISIPAEILSKPTRLTDIEFALIKTHPQVGYDILKEIQFPWPIARMVYQHHERLDGSGYPQGLAGDEILMESRILAVADVVEAMASHRPYRPAVWASRKPWRKSQHIGAGFTMRMWWMPAFRFLKKENFRLKIDELVKCLFCSFRKLVLNFKNSSQAPQTA